MTLRDSNFRDKLNFSVIISLFSLFYPKEKKMEKAFEFSVLCDPVIVEPLSLVEPLRRGKQSAKICSLVRAGGRQEAAGTMEPPD